MSERQEGDAYTSAHGAYRGIHRMLGEYLGGWVEPPDTEKGWRAMLGLAALMREIEEHTDVSDAPAETGQGRAGT